MIRRKIDIGEEERCFFDFETNQVMHHFLPFDVKVMYEKKFLRSIPDDLFFSERNNSWMAKYGARIKDISSWFPENHNLFGRQYYLIKARRPCWKCKLDTAIHTILFLGGFEFHQDLNAISLISHPVFTYFASDFDTATQSILERFAPEVKQSYSKSIDGDYYGNQCEKCSALQGDYHLHMPGDGFMSGWDTGKSPIESFQLHSHISADAMTSEAQLFQLIELF